MMMRKASPLRSRARLNQLRITESIQILRLCCIACLHRFVLSTTLGGEANRPGEIAKIYRRQELLARLEAVAKHAEHAACHHGRRRLTDAAAGHASMRAFDDHGNALWCQKTALTRVALTFRNPLKNRLSAKGNCNPKRNHAYQQGKLDGAWFS